MTGIWNSPCCLIWSSLTSACQNSDDKLYKLVADLHRHISDAPSPGSNFLHFHAVFRKIWPIDRMMAPSLRLAGRLQIIDTPEGNQGLHLQETHLLQECIPVGCIPSAAVALGGGGVCQGGYAQGGCMPGGCLLGVSVLVHAGIHTLPLWTEWQTLVKTLLFHNYVVDGKNCSKLVNNEWWIQDFPEAVSAYYLANFFLETAWKWKTLDQEGTYVRPWRPLLDPPMIICNLVPGNQLGANLDLSNCQLPCREIKLNYGTLTPGTAMYVRGFWQ